MVIDSDQNIAKLYTQLKVLLQEVNDDCLESSLNKSNVQDNFKKYNINLFKINKIKDNIAIIKSLIADIDENTCKIENNDYISLKKMLKIDLNLPELYRILSSVVSVKKTINSECKIVDNLEETIVCEIPLNNV